MKHSLERTSPKGQPFIGTCALCGKPGLPITGALEDCENVRGLTQEQAVIEAIVGPAKDARAAHLETVAQFLWQLLDDIDTVSDAVKGDDKAYRRACERINRRRFEVGKTDGYTVSFEQRLRK